MFDDASFQMNFLNRLAFNRYGGSENELRAAELIREEIAALGGESRLFPFTVPAYSVTTAKFEILEPYRKEITVTGVGRTGSTPPEGLEADFAYVEAGDEVHCRNIRGKIVLVNNVANYTVYKRLLEEGAAGFVVFSGSFLDDEEKTDLDQRYLRTHLTEEGIIPGVCMRCADAIHMMENPPTRVRMTLEGKSFDNPSRNVTAFLRGSVYPDEELLMTAHYDSTIFGCGAWDNASGSANLLEMYRYYLENPPMRSIRFLWCGSEEQGLLGSTAYAEANPEELEKIVFCINFDMTGTRLGNNLTILTGDEELRQFVRLTAREKGYASRFQNGVHSSDSAPFCLRGIPAVGIWREGQATGHNRNDVPWPLCGEKLKEATDFAKVLADRVLSSVQPPFKRTMPDDMMKELERYFRRGRPETPKEK